MDEQTAPNVDVNKKVVDEITTCCICTEVYTDPKALPCLHTFCLNCIKETCLTINKGPGDEMPCPLCRRLFKIPPEGCCGLPKNFFIQRLIEASKDSDPSAETRNLCTVCLEVSKEEEGEIIPTAETYCVDCKKKLCELCCSEHKKFKLTINHNLMTIDAMTNLAPSFCELHQKRILDVYCDDCKTVVCAICFIDDHKGHTGSDVDKFAGDFRKQIENNVTAINACRSKVQTKQSDILKLKKDIQERVKSLECDILSRRDKLKQLIDKHATALLQDLCSIKQSKLKEIQLASEDVETIAVSLETYNSYCQTMMVKGSASEICREFSDLSAKSEDLQRQCQSTYEIEILSFNFRLKKSVLGEFLEESCDNLIGEIGEQVESSQPERRTQSQFAEEEQGESRQQERRTETELAEEENRQDHLSQRERLNHYLRVNERLMMELEQQKQRLLAELRYYFDPNLVQTIRTTFAKREKRWFGKAEESKYITGMTILENELFAVSEDSSEVQVYDAIEFNLRRRLNLMELVYPTDIVSCRRNRCLYISNTGRGSDLLRVDPNGKLIKKWTPGICVYDLSVTNESNVLFSDFSEVKLYEYSPDGQLIREIKLASNVCTRDLRHAIKLTNGDFVICNSSNLGGDLHRVCVVDGNGQLKKSFSRERGSIFEGLHEPVHMAVDANGHVIVVDGYYNRVLLLDSDLKFKREILRAGKHGLRHPGRILPGESNGRLFVADIVTGLILAFDFK